MRGDELPCEAMMATTAETRPGCTWGMCGRCRPTAAGIRVAGEWWARWRRCRGGGEVWAAVEWTLVLVLLVQVLMDQSIFMVWSFHAQSEAVGGAGGMGGRGAKRALNINTNFI